MAERDRAAVGVHVPRIVGEPELAQHCERLGGEGLVQLDHIQLCERKPREREHLARRRHGSHPHDARLDPGGGRRDDAGARGEAPAPHGALRGDEQRAGAVVDTRGIAGRHRAVGAKGCRERGELLERRLRSRMLIACHDERRLALALRNLHRHELAREEAAPGSRRRALLTAQREAVLIRARDVELRGDVLAGLRHGVDAEAFLQARIDETPADGGVEDLGVAAEGTVRLRHHEWRARHRFDAPGDRELHLAGTDRAGGDRHRIEPGAAEAIDRGPRHRYRQSREQPRHASDVAVVLARLVGAAEEHLLDCGRIERRLALEERRDGDRRQVIGAHRCERTAVAPDRRADRLADEGLGRAVWC